jgi:hypothetical protein
MAYERFPLIGHGITGYGRLGYTLAAILDPRTDVGLRLRLWSLWAWLADHVRRPWCFVVGCDHGTHVFRSWCLYTCSRCGCEMFGRAWDDIQASPVDDDYLWARGDER